MTPEPWSFPPPPASAHHSVCTILGGAKRFWEPCSLPPTSSIGLLHVLSAEPPSFPAR
jgi:hypothetical protein